MNGINGLIFLILVAGHTEIQVMLINRVHSQRLRRNILRHLEHLHELFILAFPPLLIGLAGFSGPNLLQGGRWQDASTFWQCLFLMCGLGFVAQVICAVRWMMRKTPAAVLEKSSSVFDVAKKLAEKPAGPGLSGFLARLPGNQVFQVEFLHQDIFLDRLPPAWDGVTILQLTDWHLFGTPDRRFFEEVTREIESLHPDLICFTGDLLDAMDCLEWLPGTLGRLKAPLGQFFLLGNHDWLLDPPAIRRKMQEIGWQDVGSKTVQVSHENLPLFIGGSERPWMGQHPDFGRAPENALRLFLSHTPDNFGWAQSNQVDLMLSGHNHGGQIVLPVIGPMYTPSLYGVRYSSGSWQENGTILYVSRGLSGGHAIRYNCRPEVSLLRLRCPIERQENQKATRSQTRELPLQSESARIQTGSAPSSG